MTTITGTLQHPVTGELATGYVRFRLVNERGERVTDATVDGGAVVGESIAALSSGAYSVVLPANIDIQSDQQATYWQRTHGDAVRRLLVPASGTWDELDDGITVDPPMSAPDPVATNLVTSSTITAQVTGLVVVAFPPVIPEIPGVMVTVPDLTYSVKLEGRAPLYCPATSNITVGAAFGLDGTSDLLCPDWFPMPTATLPVTYKPFMILPPHSAGDYVLHLYSFTNVTLTCDASASNPAGIWVYGI